MAAPILGIEYSKDSIKVVEAVFGRRLKILNFAVIESGAVPADRRAEHLQHALESRSFTARKAIVAFNGPGVEHKLLQLPSLSPREMGFVMAREARKVLAVKDAAWTWQELGTKDEVGIRKSQVLLVATGTENLKAVDDTFGAAKFKVVQVTTAAESMVNLLSHTSVSKKDAVRCVVHLAGNRGQILFVRDGVLLLSRDVQIDYEGVAPDEQTSRMITELKRSSLFFRQNFPQAAMSEILFSGDSKLLGALAAAANQEFGIESGMLRFEDSIDTSGLRGDWDALRFNLPALGVALGAAWRKEPGAGINLLAEGRPSARAKAGVGRLGRILIPASVALVVLSGGYYYAAKSRINPRLAQLEQQKQEIQGILDRAVERQRLVERDAALVRLTRAKDWKETFRALSYVVPETAVFENVKIEGQGRPVLKIQGRIVASLAGAAADYNGFVSSLRRIPGIIAVKASTPPSETEGGKSLIRFEVQCELS